MTHLAYGSQATWRKGERGRFGCDLNKGTAGSRESQHPPRVLHDTEATWVKSSYWVRDSGLCWIVDRDGLGSELKPLARATRFDLCVIHLYISFNEWHISIYGRRRYDMS